MSKETKTVGQLLKEKFAGFKKKHPTLFGEGGNGETFADVTLEDGTVLTYEGELAVDTVIFIKTDEGNTIAPPETYVLEDGTSIVVGEEGKITEVVAPVENDKEFTKADLEAAATAAAKKATEETEKKFNTQIAELRKEVGEFSELIEKLPSEKPGKTKFGVKSKEGFNAKQNSLLTSRRRARGNN